MSHSKFGWAALAFAIILGVIVIAADEGRLPAFIARLYDFPYGDKVGHFILIGGLAFLVNMSVTSWRGNEPWLTLLIASLVITAIVSLEEASQSFFQSRHANWQDLASSYAGILVLGGLAAYIRLRKRKG